MLREEQNLAFFSHIEKCRAELTHVELKEYVILKWRRVIFILIWLQLGLKLLFRCSNYII